MFSWGLTGRTRQQYLYMLYAEVELMRDYCIVKSADVVWAEFRKNPPEKVGRQLNQF
jgi:hypothetical protein